MGPDPNEPRGPEPAPRAEPLAPPDPGAAPAPSAPAVAPVLDADAPARLAPRAEPGAPHGSDAAPRVPTIQGANAPVASAAAEPTNSVPAETAEGKPSGIDVNAEIGDATVGRDLTVIGQKNIGTYIENWHAGNKDREEARRDRLQEYERLKTKRVFTPPGEYALALQARSRLLLIQGDDHTGRRTCAIGYALAALAAKELEAGGPVQFYQPVPRPRKFEHLITELNPQPGAVYLIEDFFQTTGVSASELGSLELLQNELATRKAIVIGTIPPLVDPSARAIGPALLTSQVPSLDTVLERHVHWYTGEPVPGAPDEVAGSAVARLPVHVAELVRTNKVSLALALQTPVNADAFCLRLCSDPRFAHPEVTAAELLTAAREVAARDQQVVKEWFDRRLNANQRLLALLVGLFKGMPRETVEGFYTRAVEQLRGENLRYRDVREFGFDDLYRTIRVRPEKMAFADPAIEQHVQWQVRNYAHLLWTVMQLVRASVTEFRGPAYWQFRQCLGWAIGRFGVGQFGRLRPILDALAAEEHGGIAKVAGYALQEVARQGDAHDAEFHKLVSEWAQSHDPARMWTAAVTLNLIHEELTPEHPGRTARRWTAQPFDLVLAQLAGDFTQVHPEVERAVAARARDEVAALHLRRPYFKGAWEKLLPDLQQAPGVLIRLREDARIDAQDEIGNLVSETLEAVTNALRALFTRDPAAGLKTLRGWLSATPVETADATPGAAEPAPEPPTAARGGAPPNRPATPGQKKNRRFVAQMVGRLLFRAASDQGDEAEPLSDGVAGALLELLPHLLDADQEQVVDPILRTLAGWMRETEWRDRVIRGVLGAANRATPDQRLQLRRGLLRTWFNDRDAEVNRLPEDVRNEVRRSAEKILVRARILEGRVADLPNGFRGVLVIDTGRDGRKLGTAAETGFQLFELLSPQTDIVVRRLGDTGWGPAAGEVRQSEFRPVHNYPGLLVPILEGLQRPAGPGAAGDTGDEDIAFVLVPYWGNEVPLDYDDLAQPPAPPAPVEAPSLFRPAPAASAPPKNEVGERWRERVIVVPLGGELGEQVDANAWAREQLGRAPRESERLRSLEARNQETARRNQLSIEFVFNAVIEPQLVPHLAQKLAGRTADGWWELLRRHLPPDSPPDPGAVAAWLRSESRRLDDFSGDDRVDRARVASATAQWLALTDFAQTVAVLKEWLSADDGAARALGLACARAVLRVRVTTYLGTGPRPNSPLDLSALSPVLELAPLLAAHEPPPWPALGAALDFLQYATADAGWRDRFAGPGGPAEAALDELARGATDELVRDALRRYAVENWLGGFEFALDPRPEARPEPVLVALADELLGRLGPLVTAPAEPSPDKVPVLLVLDVGTKTELVRRLDQVAQALLRRLEERKLGKFQVVAVRLGDVRPVAVSGARLPPPAAGPRRARLLCPLLETDLAQRAAALVLLAAEPPLDLDDVQQAFPRAEQCCWYSTRNKPDGLVWQFINPHSQDEAPRAAEDVLKVLLRLFERTVPS